MAEQTEFERRQVFYSGHVQGVGFRYTTRSIARRYDVTGFVRNLHDGRVEVVAEGTRDELDRFLDAISGAMGANIRAMQFNTSDGKGEFDGFDIRL